MPRAHPKPLIPLPLHLPPPLSHHAFFFQSLYDLFFPPSFLITAPRKSILRLPESLPLDFASSNDGGYRPRHRRSSEHDSSSTIKINTSEKDLFLANNSTSLSYRTGTLHPRANTTHPSTPPAFSNTTRLQHTSWNDIGDKVGSTFNDEELNRVGNGRWPQSIHELFRCDTHPCLPPHTTAVCKSPPALLKTTSAIIRVRMQTHMYTHGTVFYLRF